MIFVKSSIVVLFAATLLWCFFASQVNGEPYYNDLKVTWGMDPSDPTKFVSLPRKEADALAQGWTMIHECWHWTHRTWVGKRYSKMNDLSIVLLFDVRGNIAGLQMGIPENLPNGFPNNDTFGMQGYFTPWLVRHHYFHTVYFMDPRKICTDGRSDEEIDYYGTVTRLYFQKQGSYIYSNELPMYPNYAERFGFVESGCRNTMGRHYWYELSNTTNCRTYKPVFLLASHGRVNGFGWVLTTFVNSSRFEHPPTPYIKSFMTYTPPCIDDVGPMTTLHVFFTSNVTQNTC